MNYKQSGVDIDTANETKNGLKTLLKTDNPRVLNGIGAFGSLYDFHFPEYKHPVLVTKTEEPGSKQLLAFQHNQYESIGKDMINHLINDCIVMGAKPLAVQDAIICGKLEKDKITRIITGINEACIAQDCVLTGGEISEQPSVIPEGTYILTSSIVGIVEKEDIIDGSTILPGDVVIGLKSSGPHTNGYSLIRKMLEEYPQYEAAILQDETFIDLVLKVHRCYYPYVKGLFRHKVIKGMAHITGGGIAENLNRILPNNVDAIINTEKIDILPIFYMIKSLMSLSYAEMFRIFNMGIGMTIVCSKDDVEKTLRHFDLLGLPTYIIGEIVPGAGKVQLLNICE